MIEGLKGRSRSLLLFLCSLRSWCMVGGGGYRLGPGSRRSMMMVERRCHRRLIG